MLEAQSNIIARVDELRWQLPPNLNDLLAEQIYTEATQIAARSQERLGASQRLLWERRLDWLLTNRYTGIPLMVLLLAIVLWITISGANYPSALLAALLVDWGWPALKAALAPYLAPWLLGVLVDGVYLTSAWVVSVMLPPMAIFFPIFTILEDFGYLPRVAFNLDRIFQRAGAHGKQALTMSMGWGCNAAGVVAARIIDSPRERIIAIITNNFSLCNGRWPMQFLIATVFLGSLVQAEYANLVATLAVLFVALLGIVLALVSSALLSRTVLRGHASTFSLELPPYRPPQILKTLYTAFFDRTIFVLWRAIVFAAPAGAAIWLVGNIEIAQVPLAKVIIDWLNPLAGIIGLNGVILLAYIIAIPANEIVIPTILMLTAVYSGELHSGSAVMFEASSHQALGEMLAAGGWTITTAICLMLFSLCHNPCSTTIYTIYKETKSLKWTTLSVLIPLAWGFLLCAIVTLVWM